MSIKKNINKTKFNISKFCKLLSFKFIKLLPINVKKVRKAKESVAIKITIMNIFLFNKDNII